MDEKLLVTASRAAEILGCTLKTVYTYIRKGHLRNISPDNRTHFLNLQELEEFKSKILPTFKTGRPRSSNRERCEHCGQTLKGKTKRPIPQTTTTQATEGEAK